MEIKVYTKDHCPYCMKAKNTLDAAGLEYKEIELKTAEDFEELKSKSGLMTMPQIFVGETLIGGSDDLDARIEEVKELAAK